MDETESKVVTVDLTPEAELPEGEFEELNMERMEAEIREDFSAENPHEGLSLPEALEQDERLKNIGVSPLRHDLELLQDLELPPVMKMKEITRKDLSLAERMVSFAKEFSKPECIGLAANQLRDTGVGENLDRRICIIRQGDKDEATWIRAFNPIILDKIGKVGGTRETCFSYPGRKILAKRHESVFVEWTDEDSEVHKKMFIGLTAVCWQHELDHLDGNPFTFEVPYETHVGEKKIGRNDPCSCMSGKKYKKCCGRGGV